MSNATLHNRRLPASKKDHRVPISATDHKELEQLYDVLRRGQARLVGPSREARLLPESLHSFLTELTGLLTEGKSVMIVQDQATFTTMEAAAALGVSRQFLVNLLEKGGFPYHMVGTHRRVYAQDLFRYKAQRDRQRRQVIRELAQAEAREGLYDRTSAR
ncbi:DNA binding domain protein, excisionase family [Candidatus Sulfopaludibacter sp. SbA4]|nr:DNA binding domain protein, excisionase family [Candidatus Sulfopaludibacter sp. SbA4]